jgi:N-acetylglucosaminyldiphosphoundecaprenol N-acetyl-beta-D-mannosaminyltransferase
MSEFARRIPTSLFFGVGAVFDIYTGSSRLPPRWIRGSGFEWLYRLLREPRRLARRYGRVVPMFILGNLRHRPRVVARGPNVPSE